MNTLFNDMPQGQGEMKDWDGNPIPVSPNPCLRLYGAMEGKKCKACKHLIQEKYRSASYFKCELRTLTRGPGSDHRANWQACKKFEQAEPEPQEQTPKQPSREEGILKVEPMLKFNTASLKRSKNDF